MLERLSEMLARNSISGDIMNWQDILKKEKTSRQKDPACYDKVKAKYTEDGGTWPSAYGSGALVQCRKVGASNWGKKKKK